MRECALRLRRIGCRTPEFRHPDSDSADSSRNLNARIAAAYARISAETWMRRNPVPAAERALPWERADAVCELKIAQPPLFITIFDDVSFCRVPGAIPNCRKALRRGGTERIEAALGFGRGLNLFKY